MPTDVIMPQMGESIFEGTITKWLKKPGETVEKDEPLFEISTDKVDAEIPSPTSGVLSEIKFPEGTTVQVNTVVAILADSNGSIVATSQEPVQGQPRQAGSATITNGQSSTQEAISSQAPPPSGDGIEIVMPQMGESIFEGTITKWLKKVGDTVQKDEPLFEISTDKVDAEIPAPLAGVLTEIKINEGETVQVNTVVAVIGGAASAIKSAQQAPQSTAKVPTQTQLPAPVAPQAQSTSSHTDGKRRSSPLVRRIAKKHNLNLAHIPGTGSSGRITKEDILRYLNDPTSKAESTSLATPVQVQPLSAQLVPMTKMRVIIAQRMSESKRTIPHAHTVYKVDMTRIANLRSRERAGFEQRNGVKLTYMPFTAAATIDALRKFPILNASIEGANIQFHANINLGIAVALEWGLIVPVIRASETQNFVALARAIADLGGRARTKKLKPDEVGGSTFTLTNAGIFGGEFGTPVVNPPEAAILAIGGLRKEPVVVTDEDENDSIAIRSMQYFCLGFDHRLIDGADSGRFMTELKNALENWDQPVG